MIPSRKFYAITLIFVFIIFCLGAIGYKVYNKNSLRDMQGAFSHAQSSDELLLDFASTYSGKLLAGIAWLYSADNAYANKSYFQANSYYKQSLTSLRGSPMHARAQVGCAITYFHVQQSQNAVKILKQLIDSKPLPPTAYNEEARYSLGYLALHAGNIEEANRIFTDLSHFSAIGFWSKKSNFIFNRRLEKKRI